MTSHETKDKLSVLLEFINSKKGNNPIIIQLAMSNFEISHTSLI